mmetsp:Transcript_31463/g.74763  ORF Transcript_31463/g.74763 Transcript_31463/m.74763 type:complete len:252 (-) Transcript_31463:4265-5020(-)
MSSSRPKRRWCRPRAGARSSATRSSSPSLPGRCPPIRQAPGSQPRSSSGGSAGAGSRSSTTTTALGPTSSRTSLQPHGPMSMTAETTHRTGWRSPASASRAVTCRLPWRSWRRAHAGSWWSPPSTPRSDSRAAWRRWGSRATGTRTSSQTAVGAALRSDCVPARHTPERVDGLSETPRRLLPPSASAPLLTALKPPFETFPRCPCLRGNVTSPLPSLLLMVLSFDPCREVFHRCWARKMASTAPIVCRCAA